MSKTKYFEVAIISFFVVLLLILILFSGCSSYCEQVNNLEDKIELKHKKIQALEAEFFEDELTSEDVKQIQIKIRALTVDIRNLESQVEFFHRQCIKEQRKQQIKELLKNSD